MCIKEVYSSIIVVNAFNIRTKNKETVKQLFKNVGVIENIVFHKDKMEIVFECIFDEVLIYNLYNGYNNIINNNIIININNDWLNEEIFINKQKQEYYNLVDYKFKPSKPRLSISNVDLSNFETAEMFELYVLSKNVAEFVLKDE